MMLLSVLPNMITNMSIIGPHGLLELPCERVQSRSSISGGSCGFNLLNLISATLNARSYVIHFALELDLI